MGKAQDDTREAQQLKRLGMTRAEKGRDAGCDTEYKMKIDCKTRSLKGAQTTKREYGNARGEEFDPNNLVSDPFEDVVLYCSVYDEDDPTKVLLEGSHLVFPEAWQLWRDNQKRKLLEDNGDNLCHQEVDWVLSLIPKEGLSGEAKEKLDKIEHKIRKGVFGNDPSLGKTFFDTDGEKIPVNGKRVDNPYADWCIPMSANEDHGEEARNYIDQYLEWKEQQNEN
jgi:hypothetical protein